MKCIAMSGRFLINWDEVKESRHGRDANAKVPIRAGTAPKALFVLQLPHLVCHNVFGGDLTGASLGNISHWHRWFREISPENY